MNSSTQRAPFLQDAELVPPHGIVKQLSISECGVECLQVSASKHTSFFMQINMF